MNKATLLSLNTSELYELRAERDALRAQNNDLRVRYAHYKFDTWQLRRDYKALRMENAVLSAELSFSHESIRTKYA